MMTLYDECKLIFNDDLIELNQYDACKVMDFFVTHYPVTGYMQWDKINFIEYENIDELLYDFNAKNLSLTKLIINKQVWIIADINDVPIFQSNINLVLKYFDDIDALSTRVFIFNKDYIIERIFPYSKIRIGFK